MVENPSCQCKRQGDVGADPWDGKIPGGGDANPVLPGESHGQRSLVGYSPQSHTESDSAEHTPTPPVPLCSITSEEGVLHAFLLSAEWSYRAGEDPLRARLILNVPDEPCGVRGLGGVGQRGVGAGRDPSMEKSLRTRLNVETQDTQQRGPSTMSKSWREAWSSSQVTGRAKDAESLCPSDNGVLSFQLFFEINGIFHPPEEKKQILKKKKINQLMNEFSFVTRC